VLLIGGHYREEFEGLDYAEVEHEAKMIERMGMQEGALGPPHEVLGALEKQANRDRDLE
jgi:hypothetical protein